MFEKFKFPASILASVVLNLSVRAKSKHWEKFQRHIFNSIGPDNAWNLTMALRQILYCGGLKHLGWVSFGFSFVVYEKIFNFIIISVIFTIKTSWISVEIVCQIIINSDHWGVERINNRRRTRKEISTILLLHSMDLSSRVTLIPIQ